MRCAELEALLCDYVDGTLADAQRSLVERHLSECASCRSLVADARAALEFVVRTPPVEPPPELVTRILFQIPTSTQVRTGILGVLAARLRPLLQPRFAMGMAMTILSFSMLGRFAGLGPRQLSPAELHPARVLQALDNTAHRAWERARKFYLSLRLVYEIQTQLREWSQQLQETALTTAESGRVEPGEPARPNETKSGSRQTGPGETKP
jgi:hypothetical protein